MPDVSMYTHVAKTFLSCFAAVLRHLHSIFRSVSKPVMQSLVALVLTSLDYGNVTLTELAVNPQRCCLFDLHIVQVRSRDAASVSYIGCVYLKFMGILPE